MFDGGEASVHPDYLRAWVEFLSGHARSPQLLNREHPVVTGLEQVRLTCTSLACSLICSMHSIEADVKLCRQANV